MNPIETIFELCDAESDEKLSLNEILENDAECWNMLEYVGMQKTTISDEFSMIDKDQNGYVTMDEAYDAANTLDRKTPEPAPPACHANFGGHYTAGNYLIECDKCNQDAECKKAKKSAHNIINIKCNCKSGKCEAHYDSRFGPHKYEC